VDFGCYVAHLALEDADVALDHPALDREVALAEEGVTRVLQVFEHVDEVEDDGHVHAVSPGGSADPLDLILVSVHQHQPAAGLVGIASQSLAKDLVGDLFGFLFHAGPDPLNPNPWTDDGLVLLLQTHDLLGGPVVLGHAVDRGHRGHPLAVALLARAEALLAAGLALGVLARLRSQVGRAHYDVLAVQAHDQQRASTLGLLAPAPREEGIEVLRDVGRHRLGLPLGHLPTGRRGEALGRVVEGVLADLVGQSGWLYRYPAEAFINLPPRTRKELDH